MVRSYEKFKNSLLRTELFSNSRPIYYGFYDDNVIYDGEYTGLTEKQSDIHKRIKEDTQYLEGMILFDEVEQEYNFTTDGDVSYATSELTPAMVNPRSDTFRYDKMIGDAYLDADANNRAPAWKAVLLSGEIMSSSAEDVKNKQKIPQINIELSYFKQIFEANFLEDLSTSVFSEIDSLTMLLAACSISTLLISISITLH